MCHFAITDASAGLGVLFSKLQQGVIENRQVLTIARMRSEAEELYGTRLNDIAPAVDKVQGGFAKDDGATVRKVSTPSCPAPPRRPRPLTSVSCRPTRAYGLRWQKAQISTRKLLRISETLL